MDIIETNNDLRMRRLSLIDFASEDDFLLSSPSCDLHDVNSLGITKEDEEQQNIEKLEAVDSSRREERNDTLEQREHEPPLLSSLEPERVRKSGRYNLRKSLAWDSAFFTCAGVLDPEELSSMIEQVDKNEKHVLPIISEDIQKSSDSISTIESENISLSEKMPLESIEANLFEAVRASIQKSSRIIGEANLRSKAESGRPETRKLPSSRRFDLTSQTKIKDRSASKKQTDGLQGLGRIIKQSFSHPRSGQVVAKLSSNTASSSKRPSLGSNLSNIENDSTRSAAGRGASVSFRNTAHKLTQMSTAAKKEQSTSSEISVNSSSGVGKSSFNSVRRKVECKASPSSGSTNKTTSRIASRAKTPIRNPHPSSHLMSTSKHSSGISPASSVSEWSTESSSSSTLELQSNISRASVHSVSSKRVSIDRDAFHDRRNHAVGPHTQMTRLLSQSVKKASMQSSLLPSASAKPSGLRLPSPKIGFFDGVKTSSIKSDLAVPGCLTKLGAGSVSISGGQNKTKPAKLQPAKVSLKGTNHATQLNTSNTNLKSHKPSAIRMSGKNELNEKTKEFGSEGLDIALHDSNVHEESNRYSYSCALREKMSTENEASCNVNDVTVTCTGGELDRASD